MSSLRIDQATLEDIPALASLLSQEQEMPDVACAKLVKGIRCLLEREARGHVFVVRKEERVIATACLVKTISTAEGGYVLLLENFAVDSAQRIRGYGSLLLEYVVRYARESGFSRITLMSERLSAEARLFFEKRGFVGSDMILMRLALAA